MTTISPSPFASTALADEPRFQQDADAFPADPALTPEEEAAMYREDCERNDADARDQAFYAEVLADIPSWIVHLEDDTLAYAIEKLSAGDDFAGIDEKYGPAFLTAAIAEVQRRDALKTALKSEPAKLAIAV